MQLYYRRYISNALQQDVGILFLEQADYFYFFFILIFYFHVKPVNNRIPEGTLSC